MCALAGSHYQRRWMRILSREDDGQNFVAEDLRRFVGELSRMTSIQVAGSRT